LCTIPGNVMMIIFASIGNLLWVVATAQLDSTVIGS
jgi:hypothetical protein